MTSFEILKQADRIVAGLIREKTPPVFETCRKAYADLGELLDYMSKAARDEEVSADFARGINHVMKALEPFRSQDVVQLKAAAPITTKDFSVYFKEQVDKALAEDTAIALQRLHALKSAIAKASYFGTDPFPIEMFTDPFQQATAERDGGGAAKLTSGNAQAGEVKATPGVSVDDIRAWSPEDVIKSVVKDVEKADFAAKEIGYGWSLDLTSPEFMRGERNFDFGRDGTKD